MKSLSRSHWNTILTVVLALIILAIVTTTVYVVTKPRAVERFTEFYILGTEGKASNYPGTLALGQELKVIVGIANHEYATVDYRIEVNLEGDKLGEVGPITLSHGEKWEQEVRLTPHRAGEHQKLDFLLHKSTDTEASDDIYLWIDVIQAR